MSSSMSTNSLYLQKIRYDFFIWLCYNHCFAFMHFLEYFGISLVPWYVVSKLYISRTYSRATNSIHMLTTLGQLIVLLPWSWFLIFLQAFFFFLFLTHNFFNLYSNHCSKHFSLGQQKKRSLSIISHTSLLLLPAFGKRFSFCFSVPVCLKLPAWSGRYYVVNSILPRAKDDIFFPFVFLRSHVCTSVCCCLQYSGIAQDQQPLSVSHSS